MEVNLTTHPFLIHPKYKYDTKSAQTKADTNLINSRRGIDVDADEFKKLDNLILNLVSKKRKHNKKYDYSNNKTDRSNHTFLDYLAYMHPPLLMFGNWIF